MRVVPALDPKTVQVLDEWGYLRDKCAAAFANLREVSVFGKAFVAAFQKTFESYTR